MSHSTAKRTTGVPSSDRQHHETSKPPYRLNVQIKSRFYRLIYVHVLLAFIVMSHIFVYHVPLIATLNVPRPHLWQYIWLTSALASICGLLSIRKNSIFLMKFFIRGTVLFGLGTIIITILFNLSELFTFKRLKSSHQLNENEPQTFLGFPLLVLWYIFLIITVQIHAFSLHTAKAILSSWQQYKSTKRN